MDLELAGRTAIVIGASSGIGASTAAVLAAEGCDVMLTYRGNRAGADQAAAVVRDHGRSAWVAALDLGTPEQAVSDARDLIRTLVAFDIVVLCAGSNQITPFGDITAAEWSDVMAANLTGAFFALQTLVPAIRPHGAVVTVASVAAQTGAPHHMHYAAAKAGLVNLTKSLARELAPDIRVNCVAPGITVTAMGAQTVAALPDDYARTRLLLQTFADSHRIAQTIAFAASPVNEFMTGACLDVNSGRNLR